MQLEWFEHKVKDSEGESYLVHYLVDSESERCYATIANPRDGHILFQTDLKFNEPDHSYVTLAAAKGYCESAVEVYNIKEAKVAEGKEAEEEKKPILIVP